jgi:hypothetical protein
MGWMNIDPATPEVSVVYNGSQEGEQVDEKPHAILPIMFYNPS